MNCSHAARNRTRIGPPGLRGRAAAGSCAAPPATKVPAAAVAAGAVAAAAAVAAVAAPAAMARSARSPPRCRRSPNSSDRTAAWGQVLDRGEWWWIVGSGVVGSCGMLLDGPRLPRKRGGRGTSCNGRARSLCRDGARQQRPRAPSRARRAGPPPVDLRSRTSARAVFASVGSASGAGATTLTSASCALSMTPGRPPDEHRRAPRPGA